MARETSRYIVGIDLGTTNSAVSYVDTETDPTVRPFAITQLVAAGEASPDLLLPSFLYLPAGHELPPGALELPWQHAPTDAVGIFARDQGALVPGRLIASAKSWLAHGGVDRTAPILPWGEDVGDAALSPVSASRHYLEHIRRAWDHAFGGEKDLEGTPCTLSEQFVVLTVPASFDEAARELTAAAAAEAGIPHAVLLEEPLAAFYGWLSSCEADWAKAIDVGDTVLIVDVGGGTSDFSLVQVDAGPTLRRTAVGDHLLLGGDNIDMAIARQVEKSWGSRLGQREWSMLCHQCRQAKEKLLDEDPDSSCRVAVAGAGRSLVAATRTAIVERDDVLTTVLDGFYPPIADTDVRRAIGRGIRQMGLPYVSDPAVTRHLAAFLKSSANAVPPDCTVNGFAAPTRILFNGGSLLPAVIRDRVCESVGLLLGRPPVPSMAGADLTRAVSVGAAYYGLVRRGRGVRVQGGIARSYFLEIGESGEGRFICIMPRDKPEGTKVSLNDHRFRLATNRPARFRLLSSSTRIGDQPGDLLDAPDGLSELPPLYTLVRYGRGEESKADVTVESLLNEVGTLDIYCATADGHHRFPLRFNLRSTEEERIHAQGTETVVEEAAIEAAEQAVKTAFGEGRHLAALYSRIESILALPRDEWGVNAMRRLAEGLLRNPQWRLATAQHEARWFNLVGYLMRPGYGLAADERRMSRIWKLWGKGPEHLGRTQVMAEWWTMWRRLAGGLREGHQQQVGGALFKDLTGAGGVPVLSARKGEGQVLREQWRCLASLERLPVKRKTALIRKLCDVPDLPAHFYWVLARLCARELLHGPENCIVPAPRLAPVLDRLLRSPTPGEAHARRLFALAVASACTHCEVRNLDVGEEARSNAARRLREEGFTDLAERLDADRGRDREEQAELLGDVVPVGLELTGERQS